MQAAARLVLHVTMSPLKHNGRVVASEDEDGVGLPGQGNVLILDLGRYDIELLHGTQDEGPSGKGNAARKANPRRVRGHEGEDEQAAEGDPRKDHPPQDEQVLCSTSWRVAISAEAAGDAVDGVLRVGEQVRVLDGVAETGLVKRSRLDAGGGK